MTIAVPQLLDQGRAMPSIATVLLCLLTAVPMPGAGPERQDELFASWAEAQKNLRSLVVEFTLVSRDLDFEEEKQCHGTFNLLRTRKGTIFASYELREEDAKDGKAERVSGLFNGGTVYLLYHDRKTALGYKVAQQDLLGLLEKDLNPLLVLLDRKRAECRYGLEITRQDVWYTYLTLEPTEVGYDGWFPTRFVKARAVFMKKPARHLPKDMPRQLWYTNGHQETTYLIRGWRMNSADAPKPEEFRRPEDRPGWKVMGP